MRVADIAKIPKKNQSEFCHYLREGVQLTWERDKERIRPPRPKPGPILNKAAKAARTLNKAVCRLERSDRRWVDKLIERDSRLSEETRWRSPAKLFETDELFKTIYLLDRFFTMAIGKSPPLGSGRAPNSSDRPGKKKGDLNNFEFHHFVGMLLDDVADFGGTLELDKNKNFQETGGPLPDALALLRPYVPERAIPDGRLPLNTLQRIKAKQRKEPRLFRLHG